jgi:hypothetical protein
VLSGANVGGQDAPTLQPLEAPTINSKSNPSSRRGYFSSNPFEFAKTIGNLANPGFQTIIHKVNR